MADDTFTMGPISLCALIGGVIAFIASDAIEALLWVVLGAAIGGVIGYAVKRFGKKTRTFARATERVDELGDLNRDDLYRKAQRLGVEGRSSMNRDELAHAVAEQEARAS